MLLCLGCKEGSVGQTLTRGAKTKSPLRTAISRNELEVGAMVTGSISKIKPDEMVLRINVGDGKVTAKIHVTCSGVWPNYNLMSPAENVSTTEGVQLPAYHPFAAYHEGQKVTARIVHVATIGNLLVPRLSLECSLRSCDLAANEVRTCFSLLNTTSH